MAIDTLPDGFADLRAVAISAIRRAYGINAERHDPEAGDDAVVFGIGVYRNSWFLLEQAIADLGSWRSARPSGSLVITGYGLRVHVYRHGYDVEVDLEAFRLDDARASQTQRAIATTNTLQLVLPFNPSGEEGESPDDELPELVIIHAGNPDDGCCGIWIGAPIATEEITVSPWAWVEPLWLIDEISASTIGRVNPRVARHDELPEPELLLESIPAAGAAER